MEWRTLKLAASLGGDAAYRSASYGIGQIMGFNFKEAGYVSAEQMLGAFCGNQEEQKVAMVRFILADSRKANAVRNKDFATFGLLYNGDHTGKYASRMETAYNQYV
jgi:hypothetical protein